MTRLSRWIEQRKLTSERLTQIYLERLARFDPQLRCVITLTRELAIKQARKADAEIASGKYRGPLHGIPWGVKDLLDTAGIPSTWGAEPYRNRVPGEDAAVVERLHDAGAVLVAKLSLGALALNDIWFGGQTMNPWLPEEGSSGSSAGSGERTGGGHIFQWRSAVGADRHGYGFRDLFGYVDAAQHFRANHHLRPRHSNGLPRGNCADTWPGYAQHRSAADAERHGECVCDCGRAWISHRPRDDRGYLRVRTSPRR